MLNKKGFTLIELLAVIIILAVLLLIAIPAVSNYISDSRKEAYVKTAKQVISGARNLVNSGKLDMYDTDTTYYIPSSCIKIENGETAKSPYGKFVKAYVAVTYSGNDYDYYWTSVDESNVGIELTANDKLSTEVVKSGMEEIIPNKNVSNTVNVVVLDSDSCSNFGEYVPPVQGLLYDAIRDAVQTGNVKEYTGEHQDSFTSSGAEKIYYYYSSSGSTSSSIKNNVLFANYCWEILRTTDTGGIKIMYNGTPDDDGKCGMNNDGYITNSRYSNSTSSPAYVGYMYNTAYNQSSKNDWVSRKSINLSSSSLSSNLLVADNVFFTNNSYKLDNPVAASSFSDIQDLIGKYTLLKTSDSTFFRAYYITGVNSNTIYIVTLNYPKLISDVDKTYVFGRTTSDSDNDGIYQLEDLLYVKLSEWGKYYNRLNGMYTCYNDASSCSNPLYVTKAELGGFNAYDIVKDNFVFSNNVKLNNDGKYELIGETKSAYKWSDVYNGLGTTHYTCFKNTNICDKLFFIYQTLDNYIYYIDITGASNIDSALRDMLSRDDINTYNSLPKTIVDSWYSNKLINYSSYLEDTVFQSCRNIRTTSSGWTLNGNPYSTYLFNYLIFDYDNLKCENDVDKFSTYNSKAKLKYPIGLPTYYEIKLRGSFSTPKTFYTMSPAQFRDNHASMWYSTWSVSWGGYDSKAIRPVVSLKPGTGYIKGDGSREAPYVI